MATAEIDDRRQVADVALHGEDPVDHDQRAAPIGNGPLEHRLQLVHPVVAERPKAGAGELAAVEDRGMVTGIADDRVARLEDGADRAQVRLVAGRVDDHVLRTHPVGELALELDVERRGAVEKARPGDAGPVLLERVSRRLLDPLVGRQPQVVVGAEHDRLAPLHLDHGAGLGLEDPEIGEEIALLGGFELLGPVVRAGLLEDVHRGLGALGGVGHAPEVWQLVASRTVPGSVEVRPVQGRGELTKFIKLPFRLHQGTPWVPPLIFERTQFLNKEKNPYFNHAEAEYFLAWRTVSRSAGSRRRSTAAGTSFRAAETDSSD